MGKTTMLNQITDVLLENGAWKVTKYLSPKEVIRVTRRRYLRSKTGFARDGSVELIISMDKPNYIERKFVKACLKAKEPFPIKKVQIKFLPKKK